MEKLDETPVDVPRSDGEDSANEDWPTSGADQRRNCCGQCAYRNAEGSVAGLFSHRLVGGGGLGDWQHQVLPSISSFDTLLVCRGSCWIRHQWLFYAACRVDLGWIHPHHLTSESSLSAFVSSTCVDGHELKKREDTSGHEGHPSKKNE
jgi:hypothetical protein